MDIPSSTCLCLHKQGAKTRARPTFFMRYHPPFVYLNSPNRRQNLLRQFPLPNQPQYYLTAPLWVLIYLVAAASYRAMSTLGGQRLPGGGVSIPPNNQFLRDRVGFRSCPESVASRRGSLERISLSAQGRVPGQRTVFHQRGFR